MQRRAFLVIPLLLFAAGCAGKMDAKRGLSEEWRLRSLEENFLNFKEGQREQDDKAGERERKVLERLKALEDAVQRLQDQPGPLGQKRPPSNGINGMGGLNGQAPQPLASAAETPAPKPAMPAQRPAPQAMRTEPQPAPAAPQPAPEVVQGREESGEDKPWATVPGPQERTLAQEAPAPASGVRTPAPAPGLSGTALYNEGMTQVRTERPESAESGRRLLTEFLAAEPGSALVPNALYWIGESYFVEKNYPQAILALKDVTRRFPKHHKAAAALLKIGMAYEKLGEKDNATLYLRALLQDHPKSEPAPAARKLLKQLGR